MLTTTVWSNVSAIEKPRNSLSSTSVIAAGTPASPSFKIATICDSVNLDFLIPSPVRCRRVQLYTVHRKGKLTLSP